VVVDNLGRTVRLDEVKVVRRANGDGLVAKDLGDLDGEQADRGGTAVDEVLMSVVLLCNAGGGLFTHLSPSTLAGGHSCFWL